MPAASNLVPKASFDKRRMNSFFIQPTLDSRLRGELASFIRQAALDRRLESEVWQSADLRGPINETLASSSPTLIAVGDTTWLDTLLSAYLHNPSEHSPVFGHIDPGQISPLERLLPYLTRRRLGSSFADISGRKLTTLKLMQAGPLYFTDSVHLQLTGAKPTNRLDIEAILSDGQLKITAQAETVIATRLEAPGAHEPLIRLQLLHDTSHATPTTATEFLPDLSHNPARNREEVLHLPARQVKLYTPDGSFTYSSHSSPSLKQAQLTICPAPEPIRFITAKNARLKY